MNGLRKLVTSKKELETRNKLTSLEIKTRVLDILGDLACTTPPNDMTGWYCKAYKTLGESRMVAITKMARDPSVIDQKKILGWVIKEEMSAKLSRS